MGHYNFIYQVIFPMARALDVHLTEGNPFQLFRHIMNFNSFIYISEAAQT